MEEQTNSNNNMIYLSEEEKSELIEARKEVENGEYIIKRINQTNV